MTYKAFADLIGAEADTVAAWVKGEGRPSADYLIILAREFGVSADWLLGLPGADDAGRSATRSLAENAHEQIIREMRRFSARFSEKAVKSAIGESDEFWEWLRRQVAARVLAHVTQQRSRSDLVAIELLENARLAGIMALATEEDHFPKTWRARPPQSSPQDIDETVAALRRSSATRGRR